MRAGVPGLKGVHDGAIAPLIIGDDREVMTVSARLWERGMFAQGIRYPTVPVGTARVRLSLRSSLSAGDVDQAINAIHDAVSHKP